MNYVAKYISKIYFILTVFWSTTGLANTTLHALTPAAKLINIAQSSLAASLTATARFDSFNLRAITQPKDSNIALSEFEIVPPKTDIINKRMGVRLTHQKQTLVIWFAVEAIQKVMVASHRIKGQSELKPADYHIEKRNVAGVRGLPLQFMPTNRWVIKPINKNQIITTNLLTSTPDIIQGETVDVSASNHQVTIITKAIAQSSGYTGQRIKMKNTQSNKMFMARITSRNHAEAES